MRYALVVLFLLSLVTLASALSSQEALNAVQSQYVAQSGETLQLFPESPITHQSKTYWVVSFLSGSDLQDFMALENEASATLVSSVSTSQQLFAVAAGIRFYSETKSALQGQNQWFFSRVNSQYFSQMAQVANAKKNDYQIVRSGITNTGTLNRIVIMENLLSQIQTQSAAVATQLDATLQTENTFLSSPSTATYAPFQSAFNADDALSELKASVDNYTTNINALSSAIASDPALDDAAKTIKIQLIASPVEFQRLSSTQSVYAGNQEALSAAFARGESKALQSSQNVAVRLKRAQAYTAINASDTDFFTKTNQSWSSLKAAHDAITSTDYRNEWKNQLDVAKFETAYRLATDAFDKSRFDDAITQAASAKTLAVTIFKAGFKEEQTTPTPTADFQNLLTTIILAVVAIGLLVFLLPYVKKMLVKQEPPPQAY